MPDFRQSRDQEYLTQPLLPYQNDPSYTPQDQIGGMGMGGAGNESGIQQAHAELLDRLTGGLNRSEQLGQESRGLMDALQANHEAQRAGGSGLDLGGVWQGIKDAGSKGMDLLGQGLSAITPSQEGYDNFAMRLQRAGAIANNQIPLYMREQQQQMEMGQQQDLMQMKRQQLAQQLQQQKASMEQHQWKQVFDVLGNPQLSEPQQEDMLKKMAKAGHPIAHDAAQAVNAKMLGDFKLVQDRLGMEPQDIMQKLQTGQIGWHDLAAKVTVEKKNLLEEKQAMAHEEAQQKKVQGLYDKFRQDPSTLNDTELDLLGKHTAAQKERDMKIAQLRSDLEGKQLANDAARTELAFKQVAPREAASYPMAGGKQATEIYRPQTQSMERVVGDKPAGVNIDMRQESAFEKKLGDKNAERVDDTRVKAMDAASIIQNAHQGRQLLDSGMITGVGAEYLTKFGQALQQVGFMKSKDAISNTQAFAANMAGSVAKQIKEFGAGTGLSDADREYATKMAGGDITLDEKSIRKILDINERAARNIIKKHNASVRGIKSVIPLTVDEPGEYQSKKSAPPSIGGPFQDQDKEKRYQEWKQRQGKP